MVDGVSGQAITKSFEVLALDSRFVCLRMKSLRAGSSKMKDSRSCFSGSRG